MICLLLFPTSFLFCNIQKWISSKYSLRRYGTSIQGLPIFDSVSHIQVQYATIHVNYWAEVKSGARGYIHFQVNGRGRVPEKLWPQRSCFCSSRIFFRSFRLLVTRRKCILEPEIWHWAHLTLHCLSTFGSFLVNGNTVTVLQYMLKLFIWWRKTLFRIRLNTRGMLAGTVIIFAGRHDYIKKR